MIGIAI